MADEKFGGTVSDLSVQDILSESDGYSYNDEDDISLGEILAEFSDGAPKNTVTDTGSKADKKKNKANRSTGDAKIPDDLWDDEEEELHKRKAERKLKINDTVSKFAETFDTFTRSDLFEEKNVPEEVETRSLQEIMEENKKISRSLGIRTMLLFVLGAASCYLAFAEPLMWYIPNIISYVSNPYRYLFITALIQVSAMLLSIDVLSRGLSQIFKLKADADSAITFSCFATLAHVISIMAAPHWRGWLPYSCISVASLFFVLWGKWLKARSVFRVCRAVKSAKEPSQIFVQEVYGERNIIKNSHGDSKSFLAHINDRDASAKFWSYLSPIVMVTSIVFAAISSFGTNTPEHFFWALAGISAVSTPFFTMLSFFFPFSITSKNLVSVGSAISGWYSATMLSRKANFIVCDKDIFPKGTVTLHGLKILGGFTLEQTVCYAASIIAETKSGLVDVFSDLLKSRYGERIEVTNLRYHESGGVEAMIGNDSVLLGSAGFLLRSGVRLTSGTNTKNAVFISINRQPAGVFNIHYKTNSDVDHAMHMLVRKKVPVVLAVRDFNLLPMMVEQAFDLKDGTLEYPEIEQRLDLSSDNQFIDTDSVAISARAGLYPFASAVIAAKRLRKATLRNVCLTAAAAIIGMLLMFYLTFVQKPILVTPHTVFVYMLLWWIPSYLLSLRVK